MRNWDHDVEVGIRPNLDRDAFEAGCKAAERYDAMKALCLVFALRVESNVATFEIALRPIHADSIRRSKKNIVEFLEELLFEEMEEIFDLPTRERAEQDVYDRGEA